MTGFDLEEWINFLEVAEFDRAQDGTGGTEILDNDVPEGEVYIPIAFVISDTSGSLNTADFQKVEEDNTTTDYHNNFNVGGNETVVVTIEDIGPLVPRLEGGTNLQVTAGSGDIEVTMVYVPNVAL